MKKKKISSLLMIAFAAAGMVACGETSTTHTHDFKNVDDSRNVAATCSAAGKQVQKCDCGEEKVVNVAKLKHTLVDDSTRNKEATCTESGIANAKKCSVCGEETQTVIAKLGHDWVDDEDQSGVTAATCEAAGQSKQHCSRCTETQTADIEALGHEWSEFEVITEPKCTEAGEQKHTCSRCEKEETEVIAALGHNLKLIGDDTEPETGQAKVRLYTCQNKGCDYTALGFKATEVSDASKGRLIFEDLKDEEGNVTETGARFKGRPIGNSLELNENGDSAHQIDNELVYNKNETGDFFEYVFYLTAEQAEELSTCRLYCDAKPANYLSGDFWAYNPGATDWTPGHYIDDDPEHLAVDDDGNPIMVDELDAEGNPTGKQIQQGKRIEDFRYILYVDDEVKNLDPEIKVPVISAGGWGQNARADYVMPYTFHLHEGTNRISLRMSGGYRSLFYNFTFRPYEEEPEVPSNKIELAMTDAVDGVKTSNSIKHNKNESTSWDITDLEAGNYKLSMKAKMSNSGHSNRLWTNMHEADTANGTSSPDAADEDAYRYNFKVDEQVFNITNTKTYGENGMNDSSFVEVEMCEIAIPEGAQRLTVTRLNIGYSVYISGLVLEKI